MRVPLEFTILSLKLSRHVYVYMFFYWCNVTYLNSELESNLILLFNVVTKYFRMTSMLRSVLWLYLLATRGKTTGRVEQSFQNQKNIFLLSSPMVELTPLPSMLSDVMSTSSRSSQSPPQPPRTRTAQGSLDSSSFDRYNTFHYTPINTREATEITIRKTWIWCLFTIL